MSQYKSIGIFRLIHLFYLHFFVYIITIFPINESLKDALRICMTLIYIGFVFYIYIIDRKKEKIGLYIALFLTISFTIIQLFLKNTIPHPQIFIIVIYFMFLNIYFKEEEFLSFLNISFFLYLSISILFFILPNLSIVPYEPRYMPNRFIPGMYRLLGIEGSPTILDSFASIVLVVNLLKINKSWENIFSIVISVIALVWTSSITPIYSFVIAVAIYFFTRNLHLFNMSIIFCSPFIGKLVFNKLLHNSRALSLTYSNGRLEIWDTMINEYLQRPITEKLFGGSLIEIDIFNKEVFTNPHNFVLYMIIYMGAIFTLIFFAVLYYNLKRIKSKKSLFIVYYILISSISNIYIMSMANPLFLFIFSFYLMRKERD